VEEAGGVDQIEGSRPEGQLEHVPYDEADRSGECRISESFPPFADTLGFGFESGEVAFFTEALAQTLDPERRGAAGVEYVKAADVAEEVELAVGERDEALFELIAFARCQGIIVV
jgi:hypothetical protein